LLLLLLLLLQLLLLLLLLQLLLLLLGNRANLMRMIELLDDSLMKGLWLSLPFWKIKLNIPFIE
jgi:hypothetical protein